MDRSDQYDTPPDRPNQDSPDWISYLITVTYGATDGCLHWGLGLTPYTQYHLDIISPDTTVYTDSGNIVLGIEGGYESDRIAAEL